MALGDHIYVDRMSGVYAHHGIDVGDGSVIDFNADSWLKPRRVRLITLKEFAREGEIKVREYESFIEELKLSRYFKKSSWNMRNVFNHFLGMDEDESEAMDFSPDAVVARARKRLGEYGFDLFFNNCEHFATWCKTGVSDSRQVNALWEKVLENTRSMADNGKSMMKDMPASTMLELPYHLLNTRMGGGKRN